MFVYPQDLRETFSVVLCMCKRSSQVVVVCWDSERRQGNDSLSSREGGQNDLNLLRPSILDSSASTKSAFKFRNMML